MIGRHAEPELPTTAGFLSRVHEAMPGSYHETDLRQPGHPPRLLAQHRCIERAIRREDGTGAAEAMRHHLATVRDAQLLNWQPDL